jgi:hypothetical protein
MTSMARLEEACLPEQGQVPCRLQQQVSTVPTMPATWRAESTRKIRDT